MWKSQEEARQRAQEEARRAALGPLLNTYIAHLEQLRKSSAKDVKNIYDLHAICEDIRERQATSDRKLVTRSPRKPAVNNAA